jgi:hypothetical protein
MKTKIVATILVCLLGFQTANADIKKNTEDWTKKSDTSTLRGGRIGSEDPVGTLDVGTPISDALLFLVLTASVYGIVVNNRKTQK